MKKVLSIAGSDSSGGAGIQADLKTFAANRTYGLSVITAVTAQNTMGVSAIHDIPVEIIDMQLNAVFEDIEIDAVKIGMLSVETTINAIAVSLQKWKAKNIILDPVMIATSGSRLLCLDAVNTLINKLFPLATLITPNIPEAELMCGFRITNVTEMKRACLGLAKMGAVSVLLKGGHLDDYATDILYHQESFTELECQKIITSNTHGTGCTLSSAIAANLANNLDLISAVKSAKEYITKAIENSYPVGKGHGPVNHFYFLK